MLKFLSVSVPYVFAPAYFRNGCTLQDWDEIWNIPT